MPLSSATRACSVRESGRSDITVASTQAAQQGCLALAPSLAPIAMAVRPSPYGESPRRHGSAAAFSLTTLHQFLICVYATLAMLASAARADGCYSPDGSPNDAYERCHIRGLESVLGLCCRNGDVCLANGVCESSSSLGPGNLPEYYRGCCAYPNWSDGYNCPSVCLNATKDAINGDVAMYPCPDDAREWYCGDNNLLSANCSTGDYIVTLTVQPVPFTTISMSTSAETPPSMTGTALPSSATVPPNSTALAGDPLHATSTALDGGGQSTAPTSPPDSDSHQSKSVVVPLAVGISVGSAVLALGSAIGYFVWRKRKRERDMPARAESPPPRHTPDEMFDPSLPGLLFRSGSLRSPPSNVHMNAEAAVAAGAASSANPAVSSVDRSNSLFRGGHGSANARFTPDAVAMHDVPRAPSAMWASHQDPHQPAEIPYDGRRFAPYCGVPTVETGGYPELPG